jgi:hypothetical protein
MTLPAAAAAAAWLAALLGLCLALLAGLGRREARPRRAPERPRGALLEGCEAVLARLCPGRLAGRRERGDTPAVGARKNVSWRGGPTAGLPEY